MTTPPTPTTLRLRSAEDLLAVVPTLFGFHPTDSLVLVTDGSARTPCNVRVDLPGADDLPDLVDHLAEVSVRNGVRTVLVVAYTGDHVRARAVVDAVCGRLRQRGIRVGPVLRAHAARWWPLDRDEPGPGTPYDLRSHAFTAWAVLEGRVTLDSRADLAATLDPCGDGVLAAVGAAAGRAERALSRALRTDGGGPRGAGAVPALVAEADWVDRRVRRYLDDAVPLSEEDLGRLLAALADVQVRDVAWSSMAAATATAHRDLWRDAVRRCPADLVAPPAALLAFAAWLCGDGALAWCAVERCQAAEPAYGLAALVTHTLTAAVPPSTWEPVDPASLPLVAARRPRPR